MSVASAKVVHEDMNPVIQDFQLFITQLLAPSNSFVSSHHVPGDWSNVMFLTVYLVNFTNYESKGYHTRKNSLN